MSKALVDPEMSALAGTAPRDVIAKERSDCGNLDDECLFQIEIATPRCARFVMTPF